MRQLEHRCTQEYLSHLGRPQFQTARAFDQNRLGVNRVHLALALLWLSLFFVANDTGSPTFSQLFEALFNTAFAAD